MVKRCDFETYAQMPSHDLKDIYSQFGDWWFCLGLSQKMQIAYIGVYIVGGEAVHGMLGLAWLGRD